MYFYVSSFIPSPATLFPRNVLSKHLSFLRFGLLAPVISPQAWVQDEEDFRILNPIAALR